MGKKIIYSTADLLSDYPEVPHLGTDVVCFENGYENRRYPLGQDYFNHELLLVLMIAGESEVRINGTPVSLSAGSVLLHGRGYLTDHLRSSADLHCITLFLSEALRTDDSYLTQTTAQLLATMRRYRLYAFRLEEDEAARVRRGMEGLMDLLRTDHHYLFRRVQAQCNALFLDVVDCLDRRRPVVRPAGKRESLVEDFHALVTCHFREHHRAAYYADRLAVSKQYLARVVRAATGKTVSDIVAELLTLEARTCLSSPRASVGDVAAMLHFADTAAFCKFFRRRTGETPRGYRCRVMPH